MLCLSILGAQRLNLLIMYQARGQVLCFASALERLPFFVELDSALLHYVQFVHSELVNGAGWPVHVGIFYNF
jgi:hypothetical protein